MIKYPFNLLDVNIFPLFNGKVKGFPIYIDLSKNNKTVEDICDNKTQKELNEYMIKTMSENNTMTAVSGYLEDRTPVLKKYPQMINEKRVYHLGLDISAPLGTELYAPLDGEVVVAEYEEGDGNYGSMIVLKHNVKNVIFYTLYGHLKRDILPEIGQKFKQGEPFAKLGDFSENGNWFHHTHLQVLTEEGFNGGWVHKGYCSLNDILTIDRYCPNPIFMFRF